MRKWKIIKDQKDIDELQQCYGGFHDSCIVSLKFESGTNVDEERIMHFKGGNDCTAYMTLQRQWNPRTIELCFSGVRRLNIVGFQDNYCNLIYGATLLLCNNLLPTSNMPNRFVVWADHVGFEVKDIDVRLTEPAVTFIIAHSLRWRIIED